MSWFEQCPLCHKDIRVSSGQRIISCGGCRTKARAHNRKVARRLKNAKKEAH